MVNCLFSCWAFAQEDIYIAPQEQIEWAKQFSGVSGPGMPVEGDGRGGWRSVLKELYTMVIIPVRNIRKEISGCVRVQLWKKDWYLPLSLRGNYICVMEL